MILAEPSKGDRNSAKENYQENSRKDEEVYWSSILAHVHFPTHDPSQVNTRKPIFWFPMTLLLSTMMRSNFRQEKLSCSHAF
jgi:hypothetical protein